MIRDSIFVLSFGLFLIARLVARPFRNRKVDGVGILFSTSSTCDRTFNGTGMYAQKGMYILRPSLNNILEMWQLHWRKKMTYFFVLNHWRYFKFHRIGCLVNLLSRLDGATFTVQHAAYKKDSLLGLKSTFSTAIISWSDREAKYLAGKRVFNLGRVDIAMESVKLDETPVDKPRVLIAVCTHDEYKTDDEHRKYLRSILDILEKLNVKVHVRPHPNEKHRHDFYKSVIAPYSSFTEFTTNVFHPANYNLLVTRASSLAEEFVFWNRPVIIADLYENGPSTSFTGLGMNFIFQYFPFQMNAFENALRTPSATLDIREIESVVDGCKFEIRKRLNLFTKIVVQ